MVLGKGLPTLQLGPPAQAGRVFVGSGVGVAVLVLAPIGSPHSLNTWSRAAGALTQTSRRSQLVHAAVKPAPGLRQAAGPLAETVRSTQYHCPPGVKSILACTDTQ